MANKTSDKLNLTKAELQTLAEETGMDLLAVRGFVSLIEDIFATRLKDEQARQLFEYHDNRGNYVG